MNAHAIVLYLSSCAPSVQVHTTHDAGGVHKTAKKAQMRKWVRAEPRRRGIVYRLCGGKNFDNGRGGVSAFVWA
jgi:hypothetical protein